MQAGVVVAIQTPGSMNDTVASKMVQNSLINGLSCKVYQGFGSIIEDQVRHLRPVKTFSISIAGHQLYHCIGGAPYIDSAHKISPITHHGSSQAE